MGLLAAATMDGNVNIYSVPGVASMGPDNNPSAPGFVYGTGVHHATSLAYGL